MTNLLATTANVPLPSQIADPSNITAAMYTYAPASRTIAGHYGHGKKIKAKVWKNKVLSPNDIRKLIDIAKKAEGEFLNGRQKKSNVF